MAKKIVDNTGATEFTFMITGFNLDMIEALCKYAQMLDFVTASPKEEALCVDSVLNSIINDALLSNIKEKCKRHGFMDCEEFIESMRSCEDGEEVASTCRYREKVRMKTERDNIYSHTPVEDAQRKIKFE